MKEKSSKFLTEFKEFALKGNVIDLAIGVIIGGAFNAIVTSLVKDIIMPIFGAITGGINFNELAITIGDANIKYGSFLQNIINFLIIAFSIFMAVKFVNVLNRKKKEEVIQEDEKVASLTIDQEVLIEIRDLLKAQNSTK